LIANQNNNGALGNGDIRVFVPGLPVLPVPSIYGSPPKPMPMANDPNAANAPFGILLYGTELLITDELASDGGDGSVKVFDTSSGTFLPPLDSTGYSNAKGFHPFGMVVGPDGYLYVVSRCLQFLGPPHNCDLSDASRGDVIRFDLKTKKLSEPVFIQGSVCKCLDRPSSVVFGPDQRLYVANTIFPPLNPSDPDNIVIFNGTNKVGTIELNEGQGVFNLPAALRFGPGGSLYVDIVREDNTGTNTTGAVFQCSVTTKKCKEFVPLNTTLVRPDGLTFGSTNPTTLVYENNDQNNN
jgi:hypothetical protein